MPSLSDVTIAQNTTNMHDEFIAHRIGLLPVVIDGCAPDATGAFSIGPVASDTIVRARDVTCHGYAFAACDEVIAFLNRGESLSFTCSVTWGTGKQHARYSPVSAARVVPSAVIQINTRLRARHAKEDITRVVKSCPRDVFTATLDVEDAHRCNFCGECSRVLDDRTVTVQPSQTSFSLSFESVGNASAPALLKLAIRAVRCQILALKALLAT